MNRKFVQISTLMILLFVHFSCTRNSAPDPDNPIIATVGKKTITVREFKLRTELTPRPKIYLDKSIALNNLVCEKLLALEAGDVSPLHEHPVYQARIRGIREQAMRSELFNQIAYEPVQLDAEEIRYFYDLSRREYRLGFYSIHNDSMAGELANRLTNDPARRQEVFDAIDLGTHRPEKTVKWRDPDPLPVHEALYSQTLEENQIIGPVKVEDNSYLLFKVIDWADKPVIGQEDVALRAQEVAQKRRWIKAGHNWTRHILGLMGGRRIEYNPRAFSTIFRMFQTAHQTVKENTPGQVLEPTTHERENLLVVQALDSELTLLDETFFQIGEDLWTVRDFQKELLAHPLLYRKAIIPAHEYLDQFKHALADLIRDHYLAQEAYDKKLDNHPTVIKRTQMWEDNWTALFHRQQLLRQVSSDSLFDSDDIKARTAYWDQYLIFLRKKYAEQIEINETLLDSITLTQIPMYVYDPNAPLPMVSPSFPQLTVEPITILKEK
ncbi:peptidyl-prolyl cis-trans isomerase [candidate division KSB1 bacterium]|nr:peptidyl-prolyl cis-trans isomerase [candidate division KSB1 bacterium]